MGVTYESTYDAWLTTDPNDREEIIPVEDQPGYDPDADDRDDDYDTGSEW